MFIHRGKERTLSHNEKIASLLSFVAGMVNVAGFLSVKRLTTNVTGHFAFFVDEVFKLRPHESFIYFVYIFSFFLGSFVSNLLVEIITRKNGRFVFIIPAMMESIILFIVSITGQGRMEDRADLISCSLLFAMGLQNSLVTRISDTMVRTTHLTGLFTDLGIELSQLFFYREKGQREKLTSTIKLRIRIIVFFFIGGVSGGVFYSYLRLHTLMIPAALLVFFLMYDALKSRVKP